MAVGDAVGAGVGWGWMGTGMRLGTIWREQTGHQMESKGMSTVSMMSGEGCRGRGGGISRTGLITYLSLPALATHLVYYLFSSPEVFQRWRSDLACTHPIREPRLIGRIDTDPIPSLLPAQ